MTLRVLDVQPKFTSAMAVYDFNLAIEAKFKFMSRFGDPVNMSYREGNLLYVPREVVPVGKEDYRVSNKVSAINCAIVPRNDEQIPLSSKSLDLLRSGQNHVFNAPTGWGKSVVGGFIAAALGQTTIIIVNKTDLMDSWYDALVNVLGIPPKLVGKVQQDTCNWQGKQFVIAMAHSVCKEDRYPDEMYRYFGFMIVDEVDAMAPDFFAGIFSKFPARYRLGFSATTDRSDGKWKILTYNIGPVLVQGTILPMVPKILVKKTKWRIPRWKKWVDGEVKEEPIPHSPGRMTLVTKAMASSLPRNMEIVEFVKAAYKADRTTLILSDLRDGHLDPLFLLLTKQAGIPGDKIGYYVGGMTKQELEVTKKAKVVLATYKMVNRGTNVPHWDSLVLATPKCDVRQAVGRVIRFMTDKKQPVVLDLVDVDSIFHTFHLSRVKYYYSIKAEIVRMD